MPEPESSERVLRHRHEAVEAILNELDSAQRAPERFDARRFDRQPCRDVVPVMIDQPNGERIRYAVYTRNISPSGMSFLVGHFVYTGQHCQVNLRDARGDWLTVDGVIRRCRYLPGTRSLHEVGVEFYDVFDVAVLEKRQRPRTCSNVLVAESDPAAHGAITRLLDDVQVESRCVTSAAVLLTAAQESYYDLIIIDVDLPDADGLGIVERLREEGQSQAICALVGRDTPLMRETCEAAGCTDMVVRPLTAATIERIINDVAAQPVSSALAERPELADLVRQFLNSLPEKLMRLERACSQRNYAIADILAGILGNEGTAYGFDAIARRAGALQQCLHAAPDIGTIRAALDNLISWCAAAMPSAGADEDSAASAADEDPES